MVSIVSLLSLNDPLSITPCLCTTTEVSAQIRGSYAYSDSGRIRFSAEIAILIQEGLRPGVSPMRIENRQNVQTKRDTLAILGMEAAYSSVLKYCCKHL